MAAVELDRSRRRASSRDIRRDQSGRRQRSSRHRIDAPLHVGDRVERPRLDRGAADWGRSRANAQSTSASRGSRGRSSDGRVARRARPRSRARACGAAREARHEDLLGQVEVDDALPRLGQEAAEEDEVPAPVGAWRRWGSTPRRGSGRRRRTSAASASASAVELARSAQTRRPGPPPGRSIAMTRSTRRRELRRKPLPAPRAVPRACTSAKRGPPHRSTCSEPLRSPSTRSRSRSPMWSSGTGASASMNVTPCSE